MVQFFEYYGRYRGFRDAFSRMPSWGRALLFIAALPGLILVGLSILAFLVSLLALLLLTVPVYRLLSVFMVREQPLPQQPPLQPADMPPPTGRRHVDVTIIE